METAQKRPRETGPTTVSFEPPAAAHRFSAPDDNLEKLAESPEWKLACRVASSKGLIKSDLLPRFLLYVCEQTLLGKSQEITEQKIGIQIFHRPTDYNPGEDNIVRSYARTLRKRLDEYFEDEGKNESIRIEIPRGGYVPVFRNMAKPSSQTLLSEIETPVTPVPYPEAMEPIFERIPPAPSIAKATEVPNHVSKMWIALLVGALCGALLPAFVWYSSNAASRKAQDPSTPIWNQLFQSDRNVIIVPADSGFGILQNLTRKPATLEEYTNGTYMSSLQPLPGLDADNLNDLRRQRYTSVVDLNIVSSLTALPQFSTSHAQIRYARNVRTEDLKNSNAILIGSAHTNPWVSLFDKQLNFTLRYLPDVDQSFVQNAHPIDTELQRYENGINASPNKTYGVIDYVQSLDGNGHVLIIQGLNMAATQAAADVLFNSEAMTQVMKQTKRPNGTLRSFELLVETSSIDANAPAAQIIASRYDTK